MTTVNFTGTTRELEQLKKTSLKGIKVNAKIESCFYCNCGNWKLCGCSCHRKA